MARFKMLVGAGLLLGGALVGLLARRRGVREELEWAIGSWIHPADEEARWEQKPGRRPGILKRLVRGT